MSYIDTDAIDSVHDDGNARNRPGVVIIRVEDLHKMGMPGKDNTDWSKRHEEHIEAWDRRMQSIHVHQQFFSVDTTTVDDYLAWFKAVSNSYLLSLEEKSR
ncbi:hypothetical protein GOBAR_DD17531 [Gossypium barbadense]|nr:hypothetical protein GOBAR_DD17531 [Gossypium barbadense]